jgi:predicted Zn-dependent protease
MARDRDLVVRAVTIYENLLKKHPDSSLVLQRLYHACAGAELYDRAVDYGRRLLEADAKVRSLPEQLAEFMARTNRADEAIALLKNRWREYPDDPRIPRALVQIYAEEKMLPQLLETCRQALKSRIKNPYKLSLLRTAAAAAHERKAWDIEIALCEMMLELPEYRDSHARAIQLIERVEAAREP